MTTKLIERAFEALERMPADRQDDIARALLRMADENEPEDISRNIWPLSRS